MRVRVTPIPVVPPRAVSIAPPELDRAAPLPPTRDQGWGNSRPPAPADQRAERQRRSRRVFTPSAPFNRPWTFARKPARRGSKCVASSGRPHSSRASHARREENSKTLVSKSVFGVILLNLRKAKVEPTKSRIPDQGVCVFTAREKHDTYPYRTRTAFLCQTNAHVFFSDPTLESKHYLLISLSPSRGQALLIHLTAHLILVVWIAAIIRRLTRFRCILCSFYV